MTPATRTTIAALTAGAATFAVVAGLGWFLGFAGGAALAAGVVLGVAAAGLLFAASRRADSFQTPTAPRPRHPGAPEHVKDDDDRG